VDVVARRSADLIVANSEAVKADVAEREGVDPARIRVIRNGVELPPLALSQDRVVLRETWSIPPDALVIGSVGTFKLGKGQAAVVRTVADIRARLPGAWLVLVGDGPERIAVEALAKSFGLTNVRFVGAVADARSLYHGFDVLASASEAEGMPNVILEACAASVPVAATDAGGTREVVLDGRTGRLVPIGDTRALGQALLDVLGDPILTRRLGAAARDHVAQRFGIDRFVSETAAMYEEMANRHVARS
jgi:glycosyltransferase involved in cell wall biosynthesis